MQDLREQLEKASAPDIIHDREELSNMIRFIQIADNHLCNWSK